MVRAGVKWGPLFEEVGRYPVVSEGARGERASVRYDEAILLQLSSVFFSITVCLSA